MRVSVERSGGVAGLRLRFQLADADLDDAERRKLEHLVAATEAAPETAGTLERAHPDGMHYRITLEKDGEEVIRTFDEPGAPPEVLELVRWVKARGIRG